MSPIFGDPCSAFVIVWHDTYTVQGCNNSALSLLPAGYAEGVKVITHSSALLFLGAHGVSVVVVGIGVP